MKTTLHDRSRSTHHNNGTRPLYFHPRPVNKAPDWTASFKLTLFLVVILILSLTWAFRTFAS